MKRSQFTKLITDSNKSIDRIELSKLLGRRNNFEVTDMGWVLRSFGSVDASNETDADRAEMSKELGVEKMQSENLDFEKLNSNIKRLAAKEGISYKPLDLFKLFKKPQFSRFVSSRSPAKFYPHVLNVSGEILESLK